MAQPVSSFGKYFRNFVTISSDNRIHLWDVDTRKERRAYVEKNNLAHSYTCSSWLQNSKDSLGLFAVGCSDSSIVVWDFHRGVVVSTISDADAPAPTGIAFSHDGSSIYVCSSQSHITEYRVSDGARVNATKVGKNGFLQMTINPKVDVLAVGSTSVRLLDIPTGRKKKLDATFAGGVGALEYSQCGCYLACSGTGSREVLLFDIQSTGPSEPICVVPVSGMPVKLSARSRKEHLEVLCIFENSDACVIVCKTNAMAGKDAVPYSVSGVRTGGQVLSGYFKPSKKTSSEACEVVLAVGSLHKPQFKTVAYTTESGDLISSVDIGMENGHGMNGASRQHEEGISDAIATVLGPHEAASKKRPRVDSVSSETETSSAHMAKDKNSDKKSKKTKAQSDDSLDAEGDDAIDGVQRFDLASHLSQAGVMTMEERLENLSGALMTATGRAANGDHAADAEADGAEADTAGAEGTTTAEKPTSDSLVVLIEQALQARDDSLLEHCLSCDDRDVLEATAARLSVNRVVPFLRHLVAKFEKRPARAHLVTHWVHALLRHHTAYLINNAEHATQLAGLSQMMEQRMSTFNSLTVLGGRLDLLMHQAAATHPSTNAQSRSASGSTSNGNGMKQNWSKPMQVFRAE